METATGTAVGTEELLSKLELVEVQARVTLALVRDIRRMLSAQANPEVTAEIPVLDIPAEGLDKKAA